MKNKMAFLLLIGILMLGVVACAPKEKNTEEQNKEETVTQQEVTIPRNGVVLEEESDGNKIPANTTQADYEELEQTDPSESHIDAEESIDDNQSGIVFKAEDGDLIQPAGKDSAIEIP